MIQNEWQNKTEKLSILIRDPNNTLPLIIKKHKREKKESSIDKIKEREFTRYDLFVSNLSIHIENKKRNPLFRNVLIYEEMNLLFYFDLLLYTCFLLN